MRAFSRPLMLRNVIVCCVAVMSTGSFLRAADVTEPLHKRIDDVLAASSIGPVAGGIDDTTFARRLYLDLIGRIPSSEETRQFLANDSVDRRTELTDKLLASAEFHQHLAARFEVMLMERRGGKHIKSKDFRTWLQTSFEQNKPFHQLAAELVTAEATGETKSAAAFLLERDVEPNLVTREIGRMFFGMDLQCAQCHDHPNVDDYKQEDYYGLYAFVSRLSLFRPDPKKPAVIAERADGQAKFKSVFTDRSGFTAPRMPGEAEFSEPVFAASEEYRVKPSKTDASVPNYSRRAKLGALIATGENTFFRRNIANRIWAMMMGRGLVHPVDMHHSMNPPSHPALMTLLATEFAGMNFDVRLFVRELCLTQVYQRAHRFEEQPTADSTQLLTAIEKLRRQKTTAAVISAVKEEEAEQAMELLDEAIATAEPVRATWTKAHAAAVAAAKTRDTTAAAEAAKNKAVEQKQAIATSLAEAVTRLTTATTLLKNPADLTATATVLKARVAKENGALKKRKAELTKATTAAGAAVEALTIAQKNDDTERAKLQPLREIVQQHRATRVQALKASQQAFELVTHAEQNVEWFQQLLRRNEAEQAIPELQKEIAVVQKDQQTAAAAIETTATQLAVMTKKAEAAEKELAATDTELKQINSRMQTIQQSNKLLKEALVKSKLATEALQQKDMTDLTGRLNQIAVRSIETMSETHQQLKQLTEQKTATTTTLSSLQAEISATQQQMAAAKKITSNSTMQLEQLAEQLVALEEDRNEAAKAVDDESTRRFQVAFVEPLAPEQLAWSILQATGHIDRQFHIELAKLNKKTPLKDDEKTETNLTKRKTKAQTAADAALAKSVKQFVSLFAAQVGQSQDDFFATVDQALFFANGNPIHAWLAPSGDSLTARLLKLEAAEQLAEELYLATLVRTPTAEETQDVTEYLKARGAQRKEAVQELSWALLTSAEFRFQY